MPSFELFQFQVDVILNHDTLDVFAESLGVLFGYTPVTITHKTTWMHEPSGMALAVPQVAEAKTWSLHADADAI
jgi:hypothetical protein